MDFNVKKCRVMELGKSKRPKWNYKMRQEEIPKTKEEKDLGVVMLDALNLNIWIHILNINQY